MAGHSKWNNIKRKKEKTDKERGKIFTKIGRELIVAVKEGGADPENNFKLKEVIAKAKANNVPNDNIDRIIKKASGDGEDIKYENIIYEGYGPEGVAIIAECLTDNKNRTASAVRHAFDKFGGNLGTNGCVAFMFEQKGVILIDEDDHEEEKVMEDALDCGAEDFCLNDGVFEIYTQVKDFLKTKEELLKKRYKFLSAQVEMVAGTKVELKNEESEARIQKLLDALEDSDDVQNVYHNL